MKITPIELYVFKRKIKFIVQLTNNEATEDLLRLGANSSMSDIFECLEIDFENGEFSDPFGA